MIGRTAAVAGLGCKLAGVGALSRARSAAVFSVFGNASCLCRIKSAGGEPARWAGLCGCATNLVVCWCHAWSVTLRHGCNHYCDCLADL